MTHSLIKHRGAGVLAGLALVVAATFSAACSEGSAADNAPTASATSDIVSSDPLTTIEQYAAALSDGRARDASELLASSLAVEATLEGEAAGIEQMTLTSSEVLADGGDRTVYRIDVEVSLADGAASAWSAGANTRWVELTREDGRWLITRLASSPLVP